MSQKPFLQIKNYLSNSFFIPNSSIKPYRKFEQLGLNFMEFNEVVVHLENYNHIHLPDVAVSNVRTIGDLVELVNFHRINPLKN